MGKKNSPEYERAKLLYSFLIDLQEEVRIIDRAIADLQIAKAKYEMEGGISTPFFSRFFTIRKKKNEGCSDEFFGTITNTRGSCTISLSEAELVMLRGFKQGRIDEVNEEIKKLSERINED